MARKSVEEIVREIALPVAEQLEYELVDLEYKKEGPHWYLRLYIDKPGGVTIDDCQELSERISHILDEKDPIPHNYYLEVSSIGLDRPLKKDEDFVRYKGRKIDVKLYRAIDGSKTYTGELIGLVDNKIQVGIGGELVEFDRKEVAIARLAIEF